MNHGPVLPATCQAVLDIAEAAQVLKPETKVIIIGKSDLLGMPLFQALTAKGVEVELLGKSALDQRIADKKNLFDAQLIVSATGRNKLITGDVIAPGTALIDVGEPKPDVDSRSVAAKASFLTPVPGGVGPVTVACLLENAVKLSASVFF